MAPRAMETETAGDRTTTAGMDPRLSRIDHSYDARHGRRPRIVTSDRRLRDIEVPCQVHGASVGVG